MFRNRPSRYPATHNLKNEMTSILRCGRCFGPDELPISIKKNGVCPVIQIAVIGHADRGTVFHALDELIEHPEVKEVMDACPRYSIRVNVLEDDILHDPLSAAGHATLWCHCTSHTYFVLHETESFLLFQAAEGKNIPDSETYLCTLTSKTPLWYVLHFGDSNPLSATMKRFASLNNGSNADHIIHI